MTKRTIRSHKGGRTAHASGVRMTPQEREHLDAVLQQRGVRHIDWYVGHVEADYKEIEGDDTMADKTYKLQHRNGSGGEWSEWYTDRRGMTKDEANAALDSAEIGTDGWRAQYRVVED